MHIREFGSFIFKFIILFSFPTDSLRKIPGLDIKLKDNNSLPRVNFLGYQCPLKPCLLSTDPITLEDSETETLYLACQLG